MIISAFLGHYIAASKQTGISLENIAKTCINKGLTGIDVTLGQIHDGATEQVNFLKNCGMTVCGLPAHTNFIHDPSKTLAEEIVETACNLGAKTIMAIPGFFNDGDNKEKARETSLAPIEYLCKLASEKGIYVGVESYDDFNSAIVGEEAVSWYLDKIPALHCIFDTGNYEFWGDDTLSAYNKHKSRITRHLHCHDVALKPQSNESGRLRKDGSRDFPSAVGKGIIPIGEIISDLSENGFDGIYTIENFGSQNAFNDLLFSTEYIKRLIGARLER